MTRTCKEGSLQWLLEETEDSECVFWIQAGCLSEQMWNEYCVVPATVQILQTERVKWAYIG